MSESNENDKTVLPAHWEEVLAREFDNESDRACVILSSALLEKAIETLLKAKLAPVTTSQDSLFDGNNAPIGSFSSKIDLAYRLGLISDKFTRDLHLIRRIRNDFAHNISGCRFDDASVLNRITELINSSKIYNAGEKYRKHFSNTPRGNFKFIISYMQWILRYQTVHIESIKVATLEWPYTLDWQT